jgi:hypothetical protein
MDRNAPVPDGDSMEKIVESIDAALLKLMPIEADAIKRHYGLRREGETLEQIGKAYGFGKERVRQIEAKAIRKLGHPFLGYSVQLVLSEAGLCDPPPADYRPEYLPNFRDRVAAGEKLNDEELGTLELDLLELSVRVANTLKNNDVVTLLDLITKETKRSLLRTPNFGRASLRELQEEIAKYGVFLKDA